MLRILLLASTPAARAGWRALLAESAGNLAIVAEAATSADLTAQVATSQPDVLLLDPAAGDAGWPLVLTNLTRTRPGLPAIVLGDGGETSVAEALAAGARGYLHVAATGRQVATAIDAVAQGLVVLDPTVAGSFLDRVTGQAATRLPSVAPVPALTPREREVLQLLAEGLTNRGIARHLRISEHTAKFHVSALLTKLGAGSRAEAVALAAHHGLILV